MGRVWVVLVMILMAGATSAKDLLLFGGRNHDQFLGCLNCGEFDRRSVNNEFGRFGSEYSRTSIWNDYGRYGSQYSSESPWNPWARNPPVIVDQSGRFYGYMTINPYHSPGLAVAPIPRADPAPQYDAQAELERLASVGARLYPNSVPQVQFVPEAPSVPPAEAPMLIDGSNFDPMSLRSNQLAAEANWAPFQLCDSQWLSAIETVNSRSDISLDRRLAVMKIHKQDREQCYERARAAE